MHSDHFTGLLSENSKYIAELEKEISDSLQTEILDDFKMHELINPVSVELFSQEEALEYMTEELGEWIHSDDENPFSSIITFILKDHHGELYENENFKNELLTISGVREVYSQNIDFFSSRKEFQEDFFNSFRVKYSFYHFFSGAHS